MHLRVVKAGPQVQKLGKMHLRVVKAGSQVQKWGENAPRGGAMVLKGGITMPSYTARRRRAQAIRWKRRAGRLCGR